MKEIDDENYLHIRLIGDLLNEHNDKIGTLILDFNPGNIFLGTQELGVGKSEEYLIGKRNQNSDALLFTFDKSQEGPEQNIVSKERLDIPITQALLKNEDIFDSLVDYNEKPVFAITKYLKEYDLGLVVKIDKNDALSSIDQLRTFSIMISTITLFFALITAIFFAKSVSDPITRVRKATKEIVLGNFRKKLSEKNSDEIQGLSDDINNMARDLELQKTALLSSERLSTIGELSARLSHDLKNPLNNLNIAVSMFYSKHKDEFDKTDEEKFRIMKKSISRMDDQINDILDYVKNAPLSLSKYSLKKLIISALDIIEKPSSVKFELPEKDCIVICDPKLELVFINLINNSLHSIGDKGKIIIEITEDNDDVLLHFIDSGKGIDEQTLPRIFDPLFTTKQHGTGLATCKNIIEQHGGKISVKNNPTTFSILLPKFAKSD